MSNIMSNIMSLLESESESNKKSLITESKVGNYLVDTIQDYISNGCDEETAIKYTADFLGASEEDAREAWEAYQGLDKEPEAEEEIDENAGIDMVADIAASNINLGKTVLGMNEEENENVPERVGSVIETAIDCGVGKAKLINWILGELDVDDEEEAKAIEFIKANPDKVKKLYTEIKNNTDEWYDESENCKKKPLKEAIGDTDKASEDLEDSISGIAMPEILVPGDDGALADINFIYDTTVVNPETGEFDLEKLKTEVQQVLSQHITNIDRVELSVARSKDGLKDITGAIWGKDSSDDLDEASAGLNIGANIDVPDDVLGAAAGALLASEEDEKETMEEPETEPVEGEECEACEDEAKIAAILADEDNKELSPEDLAKLILDSIKPEEEHEEECPEGECDGEESEEEVETEPEDKINIEMIDEAAEIREYLEDEDLDETTKFSDLRRTEESCLKAIEACKKAGIKVKRSFGTELDFESVEDARKAIEVIEAEGILATAPKKSNGTIYIQVGVPVKHHGSANLGEAEVPAGQADFAHTAFDEVSAKVEQIAELKKNDPENSLYTDLLDSYDKILAQLKEYIGDRPVQQPTEPEQAVEAPVETDVEVETPEGEVDVAAEEVPTEEE